MKAQRWIIKIGSALLTADGRGLDRQCLATWVDQIADLIEKGHDVLIVSSGAVAEGMSRMGWTRRPTKLYALQASAAIGQMGLVQAWESCFLRRGLHTAQVLLTHDDLSNRRRYLNARGTLRELIKQGVVPIINENDTVANEELRFGDNDNLAALVANLVEADILVLLTDKDGLYTRNPDLYEDVELIKDVEVNDPVLNQAAGKSSSGLGRGGMLSKIHAARTAARSGAITIIAKGTEEVVIRRIADGEKLGTFIRPYQQKTAARKQWLAGQMKANGELKLDAGAVRVLRQQGRSLLAIGVTGAQGDFKRGELVRCVDEQNREVARGLINYNHDEVRLLIGRPSSEFEQLLGYCGDEELIHRDNLVIL